MREQQPYIKSQDDNRTIRRVGITAAICITLAFLALIGSCGAATSYNNYINKQRQTQQMTTCVNAGHSWVPTSSGDGWSGTYQCIK